jgi:hypothetical protein
VIVLVRAGSARLREPLVLDGHEQSWPVCQHRRSHDHLRYDLGQQTSLGTGSNPTSPSASGDLWKLALIITSGLKVGRGLRKGPSAQWFPGGLLTRKRSQVQTLSRPLSTATVQAGVRTRPVASGVGHFACLAHHRSRGCRRSHLRLCGRSVTAPTRCCPPFTHRLRPQHRPSRVPVRSGRGRHPLDGARPVRVNPYVTVPRSLRGLRHEAE